MIAEGCCSLMEWREMNGLLVERKERRRSLAKKKEKCPSLAHQTRSEKRMLAHQKRIEKHSPITHHYNYKHQEHTNT